MKEKIHDILVELNEDISDYKGDNLFEDGLLDSLLLTMLISKLEDTFDIEIDAEDVTEENFANIDAIVRLVEDARI